MAVKVYSKSSPRTEKFRGSASLSYSGANAYTDPLPSPSMETVTWTDSANGTCDSKWKMRVRQHSNATTTFDASERSISVQEGYYMSRGNLNSPPTAAGRRRYVALGVLAYTTSMPNATGISHGSADKKVAGKWYSKVANKHSSFKAQVFAGESREARRMIWTRAQAILGSINPFQKRLKKRASRKRTAKDRLKLASDSWLELQYGWKPLISDIESAHETLNNPPLQYAKIHATESHSSTSMNGVEAQSGYLGMYAIRSREVEKYSVKLVGEVRCREEPTGSKLADWGLTTREFLPTLWELLPWSFLVDYFTNVGTIINAVGYAGVNMTWCCRVQKWERSEIYSTHSFRHPFSYQAERTSISVPSYFEAKAKRVLRTAYDPPIPSLHFKVPSGVQALNMAALAVSTRLRLGPKR